MHNLRWLAVLPAALGAVFLIVALLWMSWPQLVAGLGLLVLASVLWRVFDGRWLPVSGVTVREPTPRWRTLAMTRCR